VLLLTGAALHQRHPASPARPGAWYLGHHRRPRRGARPGHRRGGHRRRVLAVDLLDQRPIGVAVLPLVLLARESRSGPAASTRPGSSWSPPACSASCSGWSAATAMAGPAPRSWAAWPPARCHRSHRRAALRPPRRPPDRRHRRRAAGGRHRLALAAVITVNVPYADLIPPFLIAGTGLGFFFAPGQPGATGGPVRRARPATHPRTHPGYPWWEAPLHQADPMPVRHGLDRDVHGG
jgi:hypothetical protein